MCSERRSYVRKRTVSRERVWQGAGSSGDGTRRPEGAVREILEATESVEIEVIGGCARNDRDSHAGRAR